MDRPGEQPRQPVQRRGAEPVRHPLRHHLRLPRARGRDDLHMAAAVPDGIPCRTGQFRCRAAGLAGRHGNHCTADEMP
jgi:hypothetical protein